MAIPQRRTEYLEALYKAVVLAGGAGGWLEWLNRQNYRQIKDAVYADRNKRYNDNGVEKFSTNEIFEAQHEKNLTFVAERAAYVWRELRAAGYPAVNSPILFDGIADESGE